VPYASNRTARGGAEVVGGVMEAHSIRSEAADLVPSARWIDDPAIANR
jgi:hypothetical protein